MPVLAFRVKPNDLDDFYQILMNFSNRSLDILDSPVADSVLCRT